MKRTAVAWGLVAVLAACSRAGDTSSPAGGVAEGAQVSAAHRAGHGSEPRAMLAAPGSPLSADNAKGDTGAMTFERVTVTEAELGMRLYPGATLQPDSMARVTTPDGVSVMAEYHSADPVGKVAAFYREQLRVRSEGEPFMETGASDSVGLTLTDSRDGAMFVVGVEKMPSGSNLRIMTTRPR